MKKISVLIPTYNEENNVKPLSDVVVALFLESMPKYDYEIIFIDNASSDKTSERILELCNCNKKIKAIFNAKNFGQLRSPYYGLMQTTGDCTILLCADFQDPPSMILKFVEQWEMGYKIVIGIKNKSKESKLFYLVRSAYYKTIKKIADSEQIEHFTGFGLYDKAFVNVLRNMQDPIPYLRGIVGEIGFTRKEIYYEQQKRKFGKSKNNWYSLYDIAMLGFTSYSKIGLRVATLTGVGIGFFSFIIAMYYLVRKIIYWKSFTLGLAPIIIGMFFLGAVQLFFTGILGEYILNINIRVLNRPLVVEERRVNFD